MIYSNRAIYPEVKTLKDVKRVIAAMTLLNKQSQDVRVLDMGDEYNLALKSFYDLCKKVELLPEVLGVSNRLNIMSIHLKYDRSYE